MDFSNIIAIIGVLVSIITLIVTIRIARIIPERDRLRHRKHIRDRVSQLSSEMRSGRNHMCKIIDIDRYDTLYPNNFNSRNRQSHFKAELDGADIHGVAFTNGILGVKEPLAEQPLADPLPRLRRRRETPHPQGQASPHPRPRILDPESRRPRPRPRPHPRNPRKPSPG